MRKIGPMQHDPLLDCLVELTRLQGQPSTHAALTAGLPMNGKVLTPSLFPRAASRAGFASKIVKRSLQKIEKSLLPVILILDGDAACVLMGWDDAGEQAQVLFPETGQGSVMMSRAALEARYTGVAIFARPHFRFDLRTPALGKAFSRHWFWSAFLEQMPLYRDVMIGAFVINLFALAMPFFSMNVYDRVVPNHAIETLWMLSLGMVLVLVMDYVMRLIRGHFIDLAGARIDVKLSALIMERVLGMRLQDRPQSVGSFAQTLRSFESIRDFVASATVTTLIDLPFALLFIILMAWVSWPLVFIPLLGGFLVIIYSFFMQKRMHEVAETTYRATAMRNATLVESLTALETIKTMGAESLMQSKYEKVAAFLARVSAELRLMSSSATNGASAIQQLVNISVIIAGVYLIDERMLTMGGLIACTMLASRGMAPLGQVVGLMMQYENAKMALQSIEVQMAKPWERSDESAFVHRPHIKGDIEFRDVHFAYPEQLDTALRGVSFTIKAGEHVVIIGRTGSGKTTLHKLMLGLFTPTQGAVRVDGIDLRQLDPADLRNNIGYVDQSTTLFYGTLRENISVGAPYADDASVVAAAEVAMLTDYVNRHPRGFEMMIGERGESLSGGQRQSVSIARAVLMDPPVLLLDEPTSAMDFGTESKFMERMRQFGEHRTMVIVTHRTSLLELATRIIVLDEGKVVADGPKAEVVEALQSGRIGRAS